MNAMDAHEMLYWLEAIGTFYKKDADFVQRWWWDILDAMKWEVVNRLIKD